MSVSKFGRRIQETTQSEVGGVSLAYVNDNYLKVDGKSVMLGNLNMGTSGITNLRDPTNAKDAATKNYVDSVKGTSFFSRNREGDFTVSQSLNMDGKKIIGLPLPVQDEEASTKVYTDTSISNLKRDVVISNPFNFQNDIFTAKDKVDMRGFKIENVGEGVNPDDVATIKNIESSIPFEKRNGGFESKSHIYMGKKKLGGLRDHEQPREAATKAYVDQNTKDILNKFTFDDTSYQLDKNLNMRSGRIYGLDVPQREDEVSNKKYVDDKLKSGGNIQPGELEDIRNNQAFIARGAGGKNYDAKGNLNMKKKKIKNLIDATEQDGAITKGYVDEIKNMFEEKLNDPPFVRENGYFLTTTDLNIAFKRVENVPDPIKSNDAANKNFTEKFYKKENEKLKMSISDDIQEFDIRLNENRDRYFREINTLKEDILKLKTKSIFLIRAEAKGPIKNLAAPDYDPTRFLFGAYDGGIMQTVANRDISFNPNYILPFKSIILKYGVTVKQFKNERERGNLKIQLKVNEFDETKPLIMGLDGVFVTGEEKTHDLNVSYSDNYFIKCGEFTPPINLKKCSSLVLNFDSSYPNIERVYVTLAVEIEN